MVRSARQPASPAAFCSPNSIRGLFGGNHGRLGIGSGFGGLGGFGGGETVVNNYYDEPGTNQGNFVDAEDTTTYDDSGDTDSDGDDGTYDV